MSMSTCCSFCGFGDLENDPLRPSLVEKNWTTHARCDKQQLSNPHYQARIKGERKQQLIKETLQLPTLKHDVYCKTCDRTFSSYKNPNSKHSHHRPRCRQCSKTIMPIVF